MWPILCRIYWLLGTVLGAVVGQSLPFDLTGIDFCMTALFVILLMDQWAHPERRKPALVGGGIAMICLADFRQRQLYAACAADNLRRVGDP